MCGIAGIVMRERPAGRRDLRSLASALSHRGPDDVGLYLDGRVGLAHTRLSIIDLAGGHQPLISADGGIALVANGEIYNYVELAALLRDRGAVFAAGTDSETILHAYAEWGDELVARLHGMFAFALYDRVRRRLLLARDRLGIKPLYYATTADGIVFASEIKGVLAILPKPPEINPTALRQYLENQFSSGEETIFRGIMRLPPATVLEIDSELNLKYRRYWSPFFAARIERSYHEASAELDILVERVMREHMRSDVPYGLFLSGGLDSAVVLAMLKRFRDGPLRSFSVGYADVSIPGELGEAERIAKMFGTDHTSITLDGESVLRTSSPHGLGRRRPDTGLRVPACLDPGRARECRGQSGL